jgi:lipoate-protein ligase A
MEAKSWVVLLISVPAIAVALYFLDRLALWLEARGLLYYRKKKPEGSGSALLGAFQQIYEPAVKHVLHVKDTKRLGRQDSDGLNPHELRMRFLDLSLPTLDENLALDEALLLEAEAGRGGEVLRVWEWATPAVVLGAGGRIAEDVDEAGCQADGVPILRRSSGGGTVLLGSGCLLFSLVLAYERSPLLREVRSSYCYILGRMRETFAELLPGVSCVGTSDLAADDLKFSGNAQQRKRNYLLHHGTLLYGFNLEQMSSYLRAPARQPEYRAGREHARFVRNLPCGADELRLLLTRTWNATSSVDEWPREMVRRLTAEKYSKDEWNRRR